MTGSFSLSDGHLVLSPLVSAPRLGVSEGATLELPTMGRGFDGVNVNGYSAPLSQLNLHRRTAYTGDLNTEGGAMHFIVPADAPFDDPAMLEVAGAASIEGSSVSFDIGDRDLNLMPGQSVTLISASGELAGEPLDSVITGRIGITIGYDIGLNSDEHNLYASVLRVGVREESKALSTGYLAGLALLNQGSDLVAGQGMAEAAAVSRRSAELEKSDRGLAAFGVLAGSRSRYETGSHLDMDSLAVMTGLAWSRARGAGHAPAWTTLGAFLEYGNGSYDTYNSFSGIGGFDGNGDVSYVGGGLLARTEAKIPAVGKRDAGTPADTLYLEASGRAGRVKNEYANSDLRDQATGRKGDYDSSSLYYGAHIGAGYVRERVGAGSLDSYSKLFWTRQEGDTVSLDNGHKVRFKGADSYRLRLGTRYSFEVGERVSPYIGAAWEYEFSGKSKASAGGYDIDAPKLKGGSAIGEVGLSVKPAADLPLYLNLGAQGSFGSRKGVAGLLQIKFEF